jgi:hypothetical protein
MAHQLPYSEGKKTLQGFKTKARHCPSFFPDFGIPTIGALLFAWFILFVLLDNCAIGFGDELEY